MYKGVCVCVSVSDFLLLRIIMKNTSMLFVEIEVVLEHNGTVVGGTREWDKGRG